MANKTTEKPLERYVRLLEVISGFPDGVSPTTVAEMLDFPKATAYRLIRGLADVGLVELTAPPSASCRVGHRLQRLLFSGASDEWLKTVSRPILADLSEEIGEACFIARFSGRTVRSLEMVAPNNLLRAYIIPGQEITANTGASAKAILAYQDQAVIDEVLSPPLQAFTSATKTNPHEIKEELEAIRVSGVAFCIGEDVDGFAGIAVPIIVPGYDVQLSIAATGTIPNLIEKKRNFTVEKLKLAAGKLATLLAKRREVKLAAE